jgi:RimJ/RimL family protein N-acetyltransferase
MTESQTAGSEPIINIRGEKVGLGPLDASMVPEFTRWINDFATLRTLGMEPRPMTAAEEERWYQRVTAAEDVIFFAIYDLADTTLVGSTNLHGIDRRHQTCELGIAILDPARRGKGLGTEAVRLITDYAIHALDMHNVQLSVLAFNEAGIRAYTKAGFREYGRRREAIAHNRQRWDLVYMDVLASEWESPVMQQMMEPDEPR